MLLKWTFENEMHNPQILKITSGEISFNKAIFLRSEHLRIMCFYTIRSTPLNYS
jgi:hypothetical protein